MYVFGHLGIGLKLVEPLRGKNPRLSGRLVLLGAILPDLIDKPLYYGLSAVTGRSGAELGWISGTRTFAHTALFTFFMGLAAFLTPSRKYARALMALSLGTASHLALDGLGDYLSIAAHASPPLEPALSLNSFGQTLLWPFLGWHFPNYPFHSLGEQLKRVSQSYYWGAEAWGLSILAWEAWKERNRDRIVTFLNERRSRKSRRDR